MSWQSPYLLVSSSQANFSDHVSWWRNEMPRSRVAELSGKFNATNDINSPTLRLKMLLWLLVAIWRTFMTWNMVALTVQITSPSPLPPPLNKLRKFPQPTWLDCGDLDSSSHHFLPQRLRHTFDKELSSGVDRQTRKGLSTTKISESWWHF